MALIVIDIQNDFCTGGALAVKEGEQIIASVNRLIDRAKCVVASQDWHPEDHFSFADNHHGQQPFSMIEADYGSQVLWPKHCVQGSQGAQFHKDLMIDKAQLIVRKGFRKEIDSYSAFFENDHKTPTGLDGYLKSRAISRLLLVGLATDYCVAYSALDAVKLGYSVQVALDCCRAIDLDGSYEKALNEMRAQGIELIENSDNLLR